MNHRLCIFLTMLGASVAASPLGSGFTYQGYLEQGGSPASGSFDFQVQPFGLLTGGNSLSPPLVIEDVPVINGQFAAQVDFGAGFFVGDEVFLAIAVRPGSSTGAFTTLAPRQAITATPYAQTALEVVGGGGLPTGTVVAFDSSNLPAGWIWSDGRTIGNALSGASGRANADTRALYVALWSSQNNSVLPIQDRFGNPTVRGNSANEDFDAGKRLPVPDRRGRVSAGLDDMGGAAAGRMTVGESGVAGNQLGASGGVQSVALTTAQLPAHSHTGITLPASEDDNPDPPFQGSVIGNNLPGSSTSYTTATTGSAGGGGTHPNVQPTLMANFIIKL